MSNKIDGGLTPKKRKEYNEKTGSNLKDGVRKKTNDMSDNEMKRKGSWATRHFCGGSAPTTDSQLYKDGEFTNKAKQARRWGEPAPKTTDAAKKICKKGQNLLKKYQKRINESSKKILIESYTKNKPISECVEMEVCDICSTDCQTKNDFLDVYNTLTKTMSQITPKEDFTNVFGVRNTLVKFFDELSLETLLIRDFAKDIPYQSLRLFVYTDGLDFSKDLKDYLEDNGFVDINPTLEPIDSQYINYNFMNKHKVDIYFNNIHSKKVITSVDDEREVVEIIISGRI